MTKTRDAAGRPSPADFTVDSAAVFRIALPMTLAFVTTPLLGVVDTAVIGQLGDAALIGGIAIGALVFDILFSTFNFLRSGTTALTAQALGAGDAETGKAVLLRALMIAAGCGLAMILARDPLIDVGLWFMAPSGAVAEATRAYYDVRVFSAPFALVNYAILGWVIGRGQAGIGLALQILLNGVNITLSIVLGLGLGWGLAGVALGTVIGEVVAAVVGVLVCLRLGRGGVWPPFRVVTERAAMLRMFAVNRDIMIRTFALLFGFSVFTRVGAGLGDVALAANAVLMNFFLVGGYFLDGLASAAEQLAGRAVGAGQRAAFVATVRLTMIWSFVLAGAASLFFFVFGGLIIDLMTTAPEVRAAARAFLPYAATTPLAGVLAFQMDGVFIGATWSRDMRNMMLLSLAAYLAVLMPASAVLGNHGLWLALLAFLMFRGFFLLWRVPARTDETFGPALPDPVTGDAR
ncbi:MATE family efflux transporter [Methylobrevis pamukkalensis]|uniref:DNA-damage-inducible protein F n=1 Tax=Methylobrevis pamukkalensis TaxID=1439726 RepID=A0A1E3H1H6_9HYPH|nr:MATE family efflux transporter [Methylobrevis pamukkalensis]ODN69646.1 DNA-damage-inducible protein F [Methylobrevis pamukkalensis]